MNPPLAEIINIGDEILYGQITNTNAQWMSTELDKIGIRVIRHSVVADKEHDILASLEEASKRASIILLTGGLGPTKDDITKKTLAKYFDTELVRNEQALQEVTAFFESRKRPMLEVNRQQADLPSNATFISNKKGTAPGMWFEQNNKVYVSMPGVPYEMQHLMEYYVIPHLQAYFKTPHIFHKMIKTVGIGESFLAQQIESWEDSLPDHIKLAYLPSFGMVRLRLTGWGKELEEIKRDIEEQTQKVMPLIDQYVYGFDEDELAEVTGCLLIQNHKSLAIAESCTGGYLSHSFTRFPRSSKFLKGSIVSYTNEVKENLLGVSAETLNTYGAVSEQTVLEMAQRVKALFNADIALAITGIAGPDGGSEQTPVGTIWVAYADQTGVKATLYNLGIDRMVNIQIASNLLIDWLRKQQGYRLK